MPELPKIAKSWKAWGVIAGAIVATLVLIEKAQPYVEAYATRKTQQQLTAIQIMQQSSKQEILTILEVLREEIQTVKTQVDKDLILATIEAVEARRRAEIVRTP